MRKMVIPMIWRNLFIKTLVDKNFEIFEFSPTISNFRYLTF